MFKTLMILVILTIAATPVLAQTADPGDLGIFFDAAATQSAGFPPPFTTTNTFYAVIFGVDIAGFEFGLSIDPNLIIFASVMVAGPGPINVGQAPANWIVGTGGCVPSAGHTNLVAFTYGYFVPVLNDALICMGASTPSSFGGVPGYLDCTGNIIPSGFAQDSATFGPGCGVVNGEAPIATDQRSWGAVKAAY